jgi:hypothetical protein
MFSDVQKEQDALKSGKFIIDSYTLFLNNR